TRQHLRTRAFAVRSQALERRVAGAGGEHLGIARDLQVDDRLGRVRGLAPALAVVLDRALQVVDGVEERVLERGHVRLDVARHGQVDQQHRPVAARGQGGGDLRPRQDRRAAGGGREHDVGQEQVAVEFVQRQRHAAVARGGGGGGGGGAGG